MSWDIYGNPLRRGHCEVHPHVHEEFPCSVCMDENRRRNNPHNAMEQLKHDFAMQGDYIRQLEDERKKLAAQVGLLRTAIIDATNNGVATDTGKWIYSINTDVLDQTPAQCLAEIKAHAVFDAINVHKNKVMTFGFDTAIRVNDLIKYANQLRQQAKGGE